MLPSARHTHPEPPESPALGCAGSYSLVEGGSDAYSSSDVLVDCRAPCHLGCDDQPPGGGTHAATKHTAAHRHHVHMTVTGCGNRNTRFSVAVTCSNSCVCCRKLRICSRSGFFVGV